MSLPAGIEALTSTVLHEGHLLYPFRHDSSKNRQKWLFGTIYPDAYARTNTLGQDRSTFVSEFLLEQSEPTFDFNVRLQFLQDMGEDSDLLQRYLSIDVSSSSATQHACHDPIEFRIAVNIAATEAVNVFKVTISVVNLTHISQESISDHGLLMQHALLSSQVVVATKFGHFVSMTDFPPEHEAAVSQCRNDGLWPVLAGERDSPKYMLALPVILEDFSQIAPQSPTGFSDATEIDEMLALRIQTLTDAEQQRMAENERGAAMLETVRAMDGGALMQLHGVTKTHTDVRIGKKVRLAPQARADIFDISLAGMVGTVIQTETDAEGTEYLIVTLDDDPGKDLGDQGFHGHRFFFYLNEVEWL